MWRSLIGDTCHSLIGPLVSSLTRARLLMSSLTRGLMRNWFLHAFYASISMTLGEFLLVFK